MKNKLKKFAALLLSMAMLSASMAIPALASSSMEIAGITGNEQGGIESMTVSVNGTAEKGGKGIAAVYSKDGTLKKVYFSKTNIEKGSTEGDYILNFDDGLKVAEDEQVKVFLWALNDENGLTEQPLTEAFAPAEEPENPSVNIETLSAETKLFPTDTITVGDMTDNLSLTADEDDYTKINATGTLKYVEDYPSMGENAQTHYYLPFVIGGLNENAVVYLESTVDYTDTIDGKTYKKVTSDSFDNEEKTELYFVTAVDSDKNSFTIAVDLDGDGEITVMYTFDISALALADKPSQASAAAIGTLAADTVLYEKTAADLADNLVLTADAENAKKINATGTLKYVSEYPSMGEKAQTHYYLPFAVSGLNENAVVYFESDVDYTDTIDGKNYKKITSDSFDNAEKTVLYAVRAVDSDKKSFTVAVDLDGDGKEYAPATYTIDVSALDLEQVYSLTGTVDENISAVKLYQNDEVVVTAEPQQAEDGTYTVTFSDIKAGDYALSAEVKTAENVEYLIDYIKVGGEEKNKITVGENAVSFEIKSKEKTYTVSGRFQNSYPYSWTNDTVEYIKLTNTETKEEIFGTIDGYEITIPNVPNGTYAVNAMCATDGRAYHYVNKIESASYESGVLTVNKSDVSDLYIETYFYSPGSTIVKDKLSGTADENVKKVLLTYFTDIVTGTPEDTDDDGSYKLNFDNEATDGLTYEMEVICKDGYIAKVSNNSYADGKLYVRLGNGLIKTDDLVITASAPTNENLTVTNTAAEADKETNGGYIAVREKAQAGATVILTVNPQDEYEAKSVTVMRDDGSQIALNKLEENVYAFTMPDGNVTASAEFNKVYFITDETEPNGIVRFNLSDGLAVMGAPEGEEVTVSIDDNYVIQSVQYAEDGENYTELAADNGVYKFTMPANDVKVKVSYVRVYNIEKEYGDGCYEIFFVDNDYTEITKAMEGTEFYIGSYGSSDNPSKVEYSTDGGENYTEITVDGGFYKLTMPASDVTVRVTYTADTTE